MLQAPAHLVLIASPVIHVTGDHASFPEKYTVSGGRSVMFVENVMIRHSTLNEPFTCMCWRTVSSSIHGRFADRFATAIKSRLVFGQFTLGEEEYW